MGNLFDRQNKPDTEVAATLQFERSISKVNLTCRLRICYVVCHIYNNQCLKIMLSYHMGQLNLFIYGISLPWILGYLLPKIKSLSPFLVRGQPGLSENLQMFWTMLIVTWNLSFAQQDTHFSGAENLSERKPESTPLPNKNPPISKKSRTRGEVSFINLAVNLDINQRSL